MLSVIGNLLLLKEAGEAQAPTKVISCLYERQSSCPRYDEGCFDFSPLYCKEGLASPAAGKKVPQHPRLPKKHPRLPKKQPPAATLWSDEPDGLSPSPLLPTQALCVQQACDLLDPVEASLCRCLSTASDPRTCPGVSHDAITVASAARLACLPVSAQ